MGRKTNPIVLRTGNIVRAWDGKWFSDRRGQYRSQLIDDLAIRRYFAQKHRLTSISKIEIERNQKEIVLTVHTSRPAMVIGRGGSGIEQIQKDLKRVLHSRERMRINVQEVRNPDTDAAAVATQVVEQLERRFPYRRILKQSVGRAMQAGAQGVRVLVGGRLNGADIARSEWLSDGNVPLHTFRADISYASRTANTTYGTIGVKVWINRGELTDEEAEVKTVKNDTRKTTKRPPRKKSLARAAKDSVKMNPKAAPKKK